MNFIEKMLGRTERQVWSPDEVIKLDQDDYDFMVNCFCMCPEIGTYKTHVFDETGKFLYEYTSRKDKQMTIAYHYPRRKAIWDAGARLEKQQVTIRKEFEAKVQAALDAGVDCTLAKVFKTFPNGFTSEWVYEILDGKLVSRRPFGNKATATFYSLAQISRDFHRYQLHGFQIA